MRDIKFRAWDEEYKTMDYGPFWVGWNGVVYESCKRTYDTPNTEIEESKALSSVMQFTGLIDKNGAEIYQGDLIVVCNNKRGALTVEFINDYVGGWVLTHKDNNGHISLGARNKLDIEIIGNIHENPELLGEAK